MKYKEILRQLAIQENVSEKEIEKEMQLAIKAAGLNTTPKEFIEKATKQVEKRLYIVR